DRSSLRLREVEAGVQPARRNPAESVADCPGHRPEEADWAERRGGSPRHDPVPSERAEGRRPRDAVDADARRRLEAPHGALGVRAEAAVEAARLEAAFVQKELKRGDVPSPLAYVHRPLSELGLAALAERPAGPRPGDAVHRQP